MSDKITVTKLDGRHAGYKIFTHYVELPWSSRKDQIPKFDQWRRWCWQSFGPGSDRNWIIDYSIDARWGWWVYEKAQPRIYFTQEKDLTAFLLTWS